MNMSFRLITLNNNRTNENFAKNERVPLKWLIKRSLEYVFLHF